MIEIKGLGFLRWYMNGLATLIVLFMMLLWSLALMFQDRMTLEVWIVMVLATALVTLFVIALRTIQNNIVIRVETLDQGYLLTRLNKKTVTILAFDVIGIQHSGERYVLILRDGQRFTLIKRPVFLTPLTANDPWVPLVTPERFPNAVFEGVIF